jgi:adenylate kinase family enzyme
LVSRIAIIGNVASGKTTLARLLSKTKNIPATHIDSIQFLPGLVMRPYQETIKILSEIQNQPAWIIDGYGPLDILEGRLQLSDQIIFIDLPVWLNYYWLIKRQLKNIFVPRNELPIGSSELTWAHTKKLFRSVNQINSKMHPELRRILSQEIYRDKLVRIESVSDLNQWVKLIEK